MPTEVILTDGVLRFASIDVAGLGDNTVVAGVPGKHIRVCGYVLVSTLAVAIRWKSNQNSLSAAMSLGANGVIASPGSILTRQMETVKGDPLILNLGLATQVSGHLTYVLEEE